MFLSATYTKYTKFEIKRQQAMNSFYYIAMHPILERIEKTTYLPFFRLFGYNLCQFLQWYKLKHKIRKQHSKHTQFLILKKSRGDEILRGRETFRRSEVRGGKDKRMTSPSLLGVTPRSELTMAFSIAFKLYENIFLGDDDKRTKKKKRKEAESMYQCYLDLS